jgi:hypothetical protein
MTENTGAPKERSNTAVRNLVIGTLLVTLLIFCICCSLFILGPQIGNVFSQITFGLETSG